MSHQSLPPRPLQKPPNFLALWSLLTGNLNGSWGNYSKPPIAPISLGFQPSILPRVYAALPNSLASLSLFPPSPMPLAHSGLPKAPQQAKCSPPDPHLCMHCSRLSVLLSTQLVDNFPILAICLCCLNSPAKWDRTGSHITSVLHHRSIPPFCFILYTSLANRRFCFVIGLCSQHNPHHESTAVARKPNRYPACGHMQQQFWREKQRDDP